MDHKLASASGHTHVDKLTGFDPNVFLGLRAWASDSSAAFKLMEQLALYAKLDDFAQGVTPPATMSGCCGRTYLPSYIHQEKIYRGTFLTQFTVEGDSTNAVYEFVGNPDSCAVRRGLVKKFVRLRSFSSDGKIPTEEPGCAALMDSLAEVFNEAKKSDRREILQTLEIGKSVSFTSSSTGRTYLVVPYEGFDAGLKIEVPFQVDGKGRHFSLSIDFQGAFKVKAVELAVVA